MKSKNSKYFRRGKQQLPSSPEFSPHGGFVILVRFEPVTVETIAGVYLLQD